MAVSVKHLKELDYAFTNYDARQYSASTHLFRFSFAKTATAI
jgi:hypothetical protein